MKTVTELAQKIADQELEACCEWLKDASFYAPGELGKWLQIERRPKPPSLKEQALLVLDDANLDAAHENIIRRALEQLPDHE